MCQCRGEAPHDCCYSLDPITYHENNLKRDTLIRLTCYDIAVRVDESFVVLQGGPALHPNDPVSFHGHVV
jgi:hypothetical protein